VVDLTLQTLRLKSLIIVTICGILVSLVTGLFLNEPEASIIGFDYYGYPLAWRLTKTFQPTEFILTNLAIDITFWIAICFFAFIILEKILIPKLATKGVKRNDFLLLLILFIPLGLVMDFAHESGHAIWGVAVGGRLTHMQITYFQIYPQLAIASQFYLGLVRVEGLTTDFAHGLFLLGGSLTTTLVSWILGLILLKIYFGHKKQIALRFFGFFGILDLPFYVFFPQIGLSHWIFLGGNNPEPLVGAREMGIPDPVFYIIVTFSTIGLVLLYFKNLRDKTMINMKRLLKRKPPIGENKELNNIEATISRAQKKNSECYKRAETTLKMVEFNGKTCYYNR